MIEESPAYFTREKSVVLFIGFSTQNNKCTDYKLAQIKFHNIIIPINKTPTNQPPYYKEKKIPSNKIKLEQNQ